MIIGLGIGIPFIRNYVSSIVFDPSKLFTANTNGAWYDPSDINLTWRRNLLTYSEQFDNAAWTKVGLNTTGTPQWINTVTAPDGTITADKLIEANALSTHLVRQSGTANNVAATITVFAKAGERQYVQLGAAVTANQYANFDLINGIVAKTGSDVSSATITPVGSGWYRCSITVNTISGGTALFISIVDSGSATWQAQYQGDGTSGIYVWGAQLELGSTATPYQRITDGIKDYLDYKPLPILYQDAAGTTPVTAVGQPVGLMLDKSKGLVLGSQLASDLSGFSASNVFTNSVTSTSISTTDSAVGATRAVLTVGRWYALDIRGSTTTAEFSVNTADAISPTVRTAIRTGFGFCIFLADRPVLYFRHSTAGVSNITSLSVRELPGNHAFNPTPVGTANFPVLSARYNGLLFTENLMGASWVLGGAASRTATTFTATSNSDFLYQTAGAFCGSIASGIGLTASVELSGTGTIHLAILSGAGGDIAAQQITLTSTPTRYSISAVNNSTGANIGVIFRGTGTLVSANLSKVDFRVSNDALNQPAYQRVNTATDYDTVGFKPYLSFNGVNQWLQTNSIDFTYGDKMFVSAGVRKLSDAAAGVIAELSASAAVNNGVFTVSGPSFTGGAVYAVWSKGTTLVAPTAYSLASPNTSLISGIADISAPSGIIRVNGLQKDIVTTTQGTGNYGNYPLYIGARAGSSLWFNGRLYGLIVAGKQVPELSIQLTEKYLNDKTAALDWRDVTDSSSFRWNSATASPDAS